MNHNNNNDRSPHVQLVEMENSRTNKMQKNLIKISQGDLFNTCCIHLNTYFMISHLPM